MEDERNSFFPRHTVSYLRARDPSILSYNRYGIEKVRHNLVNDFESQSIIPSLTTLSEKEDENHIKLYLRVKANVEHDGIYKIQDDTLICKMPEGRATRDHQEVIKKYQFTRIFGPDSTQENIFKDVVKEKVLNFINGLNSTLLAYGSSGSGKTFTMVGTGEKPGIIPRSLEYLFRTLQHMPDKPEVKPLPSGNLIFLTENQSEYEKEILLSILSQVQGKTHIKTYKAMQHRLSKEPIAIVDYSPILSVYVSFAEIYNEFVYDLLRAPPAPGQQRPKLKIGGIHDQIYIKDLQYVYVRSGLEAYQVLQYGIKNLNYADTAVNMHSSRSHCIFTIRLVQGSDVKNSTVSSLNFCDLAGSERLKKTLNVGDRLKESNNINSSLLVLGRCISLIRDGQTNKERTVPPFRESKLTQIFQRALMGKDDISMMININPSKDMFDETQHTLNFAGIAKEVMIEKPTVVLRPNRFSLCFDQGNGLYSQDDRDKEIRELKRINEDLEMEIMDLRDEVNTKVQEENDRLQGMFQQAYDILTRKIERLENENKQLLKERKQQDVIVLSDEDSDEDSDEESTEMSNLRKEIQLFKSDIYNLKETEHILRQKNENLEEALVKTKFDLDTKTKINEKLVQENASLRKELENAKLTIECAKSDFQVIAEKNLELERAAIELKDENKYQYMELEELIRSRVDNVENIENLEDERQYLLNSFCNGQSPMNSSCAGQSPMNSSCAGQSPMNSFCTGQSPMKHEKESMGSDPEVSFCKKN